MGWGEGWEGGSGWGTHVYPWLIHVNVWQKTPQNSKVKKKKKRQHITSVGENMEKREASCTTDKKCKLLHLLRKKVWKVLKKLKLELPYYPSVVLLSVYVKNMKALI